jgi:hypothetical protein
MEIARHKSQATRLFLAGGSLTLSFPAEAVVITPSFGSSITGNVKAAAIEAHRARPFAH